ncbi:MAG: hypothetical protein KGV57_01905 [Fusobacterium sp.]|nr:hypothetical protein [Fusobacterium sp.]
MEIKYRVLGITNSIDFDEDDENDDSGWSKIEIILPKITKEEEKILQNCNVVCEVIDNERIKLKILDFINFLVEKDGKNKGIFLEKTKNYYKIFKNHYMYEDRESNKNLVISKNGVRVEIIFI